MDVFTPINRCLADGYAEEDIVIDMWNLMWQNDGIGKVDKLNTWQAYFRANEITEFQNSLRETFSAHRLHPKA